MNWYGSGFVTIISYISTILTPIPIPVGDDFLLMDTTDFLLMDGTNFLLLGI